MAKKKIICVNPALPRDVDAMSAKLKTSLTTIVVDVREDIEARLEKVLDGSTNLCDCPEHREVSAVVRKAAEWSRRRKEKGGACSRCGGKGLLREYQHVNNGRCFRCGGCGVEPPIKN